MRLDWEWEIMAYMEVAIPPLCVSVRKNCPEIDRVHTQQIPPRMSDPLQNGR